MKNIIMVFFLSLSVVFAVFANGENEKNSSKKIRVGLQDNPEGLSYKSIEKFEAYIEENLPNIEVELFPSSQLGDHRAMTEQLRAGELDVQLNGYPDMSYLVPELKIIGEPYVIKDFDHLIRVIDGSYGQMIDKKMSELGIKILSVGYYGTRQTTSNVPINSISDLKGLKLRVPNVDFLLDYASAVKAIPTPIAFQEVYLALQTNQVDAEENPLPTIDVMKFYEVQKYIAITNHFIASQAIVVNENLWNSFADKEKKVFMEAAKIASDSITKATYEEEATLIEIFKERGIIVTYPDTTPFREAMKPYYKKLDEKFGAGSVDNVINY